MSKSNLEQVLDFAPESANLYPHGEMIQVSNNAGMPTPVLLLDQYFTHKKTYQSLSYTLSPWKFA